MTPARRAAVVLLVAIGLPAPAAAQESAFNVAGFGVPAGGESVSTRATGGAVTGLHREVFSVDNPARMGWFDRAGLYLSLLGQRTEIESERATGDFDDVVFPVGQVVVPVEWNVVAGVGFAQVLDFDARFESRTAFEGDSVDADFISEGSLIALSPGVAWRIDERTSAGAAIEVYLGSREISRGIFLTGSTSGAISTRDTLVRDFRGTGVAVGIERRFGSRASVALAWRGRPALESEITRSSAEGIVGRKAEFDLPDEVLLEVAGRPAGSLDLGLALRRAGWSGVGEGEGREDLVEVGGGLEWRPADGFLYLLGPESPLRAGARWRRLPAAVGGEPVTEWSAALGHGRSFGDRSRIDLVVELGRRGSLEENGISERFVRLGVGVAAFERWERFD